MNLNLEGGDVAFFPSFFPKEDADRLFRALLEEVVWQQNIIEIYGKALLVPRLTAWYGDEAYTYSGVRNEPRPWILPLLEIRLAVEKRCDASFNSVLLNRYRDGRDSVAWHADDEPELGPDIASVSLGDMRVFQLKRRHGKKKTALELTHGSLLMMRGDTQKNWLHQIPKTARAVTERINLTFRWVNRV